MAVCVTISLKRVFLRIFDRQPVGLDLKHRLHGNVGCGTWLRSRVASRPKAIFFGLATGGHIWAPQRTCWRARRPNRRAKPANGLFSNTQAVFDTGLVRVVV